MVSNKPRIALVHYSAPPIVGGVEAVLAEHARLFCAAGYPATVVAGRGGQSGLPALATVRIIPELDWEHPANASLAQALEAGPVPAAFATQCAAIETALGEALSETDVVIAHNVMNLHLNLPLAAVLYRLAQQPHAPAVVAWCHDLSRHVTPGRGPLRSGYPWDLLRTYHPQVSYVAVSPRRQRLLATVLGCDLEQIRVIANGVDPTELLGLSRLGQQFAQAFGLLAADVVLLMPVRVTRAKNIEYALEVTASLKAAGVQPRLVITGPPDPHAAGSQTYYRELHRLKCDLSVEAEVVFAYDGLPPDGPLTLRPAQVGELYRLCDVVFMPSHREGFGMPVLEAGLVGKPVFATDVPALEVVGNDSVHLIGAKEPPAEVAGRILALLNETPASRLRRTVRQGYTWQSIFEHSIEPFIGELVKHGTKSF